MNLKLLIPPALALVFLGGLLLATHQGAADAPPPEVRQAPLPRLPAPNDAPPQLGLRQRPPAPQAEPPRVAGAVSGALAPAHAASAPSGALAPPHAPPPPPPSPATVPRMDPRFRPGETLDMGDDLRPGRPPRHRPTGAPPELDR